MLERFRISSSEPPPPPPPPEARKGRHIPIRIDEEDEFSAGDVILHRDSALSDPEDLPLHPAPVKLKIGADGAGRAERAPTREEEIAGEIAAANNFHELITTLARLPEKDLETDRGAVPIKELLPMLMAMRKNPEGADPAEFTPAYGLREKIAELLNSPEENREPAEKDLRKENGRPAEGGESLAAAIGGASSVEDLAEAVAVAGEVRTSYGDFSGTQVAAAIRKFAERVDKMEPAVLLMHLNSFTRTYGLRAKVAELLGIDTEEMKRRAAEEFDSESSAAPSPEAPAAEGGGERKRETLPEEEALEEARAEYGEAYREFLRNSRALTAKESNFVSRWGYRAGFFRKTGKEEKRLAEYLGDAKNLSRADYPQAGDLELLNQKDGEDQRVERQAAANRRIAFITGLQREAGISPTRAEQIYELQARKADYDAAKGALRKSLIEQKKKEQWEALGTDAKTFSELSEADQAALQEGLRTWASTELFDRMVIREFDKLQKEKAEEMSAREKGAVRTLYRKWAAMDPKKRILISAASLTVFNVAVSGIGATGAALYFGNRLIRAGAGTTLAMGLQGAIGRTAGKFNEKLKAQAENLRNEDILEDDGNAFEKYESVQARLAKREAAVRGLKLAAGLIGGAGITYGLGTLEAQPFGGKAVLAAESPEVPERAAYPRPDGRFADAKAGGAPAPETAPRAVPAPPPEAPKPALPETAKPVPSPEAARAAAETRMEELATVKKGEGVWHAIRRQLEEKLRENPGKFGLKPDDLQDAAKMKALLDAKTLEVSRGEWIRADGSETRIAEPGAKVRLVEDPSGQGGYRTVIEGKTYTQSAAAASAPLERVTIPDEPEIIPVTEETVPAAEAPAGAADRAEYSEGAAEEPIETQNAPETEGRPENTAAESHIETVMEPQGFRVALDHQLSESIGSRFGDLPPGRRGIILDFLQQKMAADLKIMGMDPGNIAGRTQVDFGKLLSNKALLSEALAFPEETRVLGEMGIAASEYMSSDYVNIVRNVTVEEYLQRFPKGTTAATLEGEIGIFEAGGRTAEVPLKEGYLKLAEAMRKEDVPPGTTVGAFIQNNRALFR